MKRIFLALLLPLFCLLASPELAFAAKRKQSKPVDEWELPMVFSLVRSSGQCEPKCPEWIAADGKLTVGTAKAFKRFMARIGDRKLPVVLQSAGGDVESALAMGRLIRAHGLVVAVGWTWYDGCAPRQKCTPDKADGGVYRGRIETVRAYCNSACPVVLSSGVQRLASTDTMIGVHQVRTVWTDEKIFYRETYKIVNGKKKVISRKEIGRKKLKPKVTTGMHKQLRRELTAYYTEMGVDTALIAEAEKTPHDKISTLPTDLMLHYRLITSSLAAKALSNPEICRTSSPPAHCTSRKPQS